MKTHDKHFAIIAGIAGAIVIIAAIASHVWIHVAIGCGLLLIALAYRESNKIQSPKTKQNGHK